jgi:hypothetical protein
VLECRVAELLLFLLNSLIVTIVIESQDNRKAIGGTTSVQYCTQSKIKERQPGSAHSDG